MKGGAKSEAPILPITPENARLLAEALADDLDSLTQYIVQSDSIEKQLNLSNKMLHAAQGDLAVYQHRLAELTQEDADKPRIQLLS